MLVRVPPSVSVIHAAISTALGPAHGLCLQRPQRNAFQMAGPHGRKENIIFYLP